MAHQLVFNLRHEYDSREEGITIEAALSLGNRRAVTHAKVDPGAQVCLFQREIADELEIDVESGHRITLGTLAGSLIAYGHTVKLSTLGLEFDSHVYFAEHYGLPRNLLGARAGC